MGNRYVLQRANVTPTAGNDFLTIISAASRRVRIIEVTVCGNGSSSAAQGFTLAHSPTGTTPGGAITPSKYEHQDQPAAISTTATTWSVQPAIDTNGVTIGWNALGPGVPYKCPSGGKGVPSAIESRNGDVISLRAPASGFTFQACTASIVFEED
jgi:hypothetical protein